MRRNCIISAGAAPQNAYNSGSAPHLSSVIRFVGYFSTITLDHGLMSMPKYEVESSLDSLVDYQLDPALLRPEVL